MAENIRKIRFQHGRFFLKRNLKGHAKMFSRIPKAMAWSWWLVFVLGCWPGSQQQVVVYTALDEEFSAPLLEQFRQKTGIVPLPKYDTESTKTVGLAQALLAQGNRPQCDVFWNNEVLHTLRLHRAGLLQPLEVPEAENFPSQFRAGDGSWFGFAARARVLIVNTRLLRPQQYPRSILELTEPRWQGKVGMAKPLFGTTATQAACLFALWGKEKAQAYYRQIKQNRVHILAGNRHVAEEVAAGRLLWGITDTDDAYLALRAGHPVAIVFPDQEPQGLGTLLIPNTVCVLRGAPHPAAAQQFVRFLLSPAVEEQLARGPSAQIPLNTRVQVRPQLPLPEKLRTMPVDFEQAAQCWEESMRFLRELFAES